MVHSCLAIICACLPVLMPLVSVIARVVGVPAQNHLFSWYKAVRSKIRGRSRESHDPDVEELRLRSDMDTELSPWYNSATTRTENKAQ